MSATVCIVGAGELGAAVADALARRECVARIVLIDDAEAVAAGKALTFNSRARLPAFTRASSGRAI
jgi:malate/lactate dehydrogenase